MKTIKQLAVYMCMISAVHAQAQPQVIYDFNKGEFVNNDYVEKGKPKALQTGGFAILKIINVNTFRWKVEIDGRSINYVTPIPSELQTLFRLPDQTQEKKKIEKALNEAPEPVVAMNELAKTVANIEDPTAEQADLIKKMKTLVQICNEYLALINKMAEIKFTRIQLINLSKQKWAKHEDMIEKMPTRLSETGMKESYNNFVLYYAKAEAAYKSALAAAKLVEGKNTDSVSKAQAKGEREEIEDANEKIENNYQAISEGDLLKLVEDIMVLQDAMDNPTYFEVTSPPIQMEGDFVEFKIKTTPTRTNDLMPYEFGKTFPVEIPVKGGLKVDFSVGPVISFGSNARDDKYYLEPVPNTNSVTFLQRDNNNAISPGLAAMMHFYKRSGTNAAIGGLFGVGAGFQSVQDANISIYAGASAVLGKREKIMLNMGVSYLSVSRLKNKEFVPGTQYDASKIDIGSITEKVFKPSFFLSISYNLTNKVEVK